MSQSLVGGKKSSLVLHERSEGQRNSCSIVVVIRCALMFMMSNSIPFPLVSVVRFY